jgi:hypothetical protein
MWVVRLTDKQLEVLRALLRSEEHLGPALKGSIEALDLARWDDLPEAELPWEEIETVARRQGISEADVIWDISARRKAALVGGGVGAPLPETVAQLDELMGATVTS